MPDVASPRRPRRRWRALRALLLLLAVALAVAWCWAGTLATWALAGRLPWTAAFPHGQVVVRTLATSAPRGVRPELQVIASPAALRPIAAAAGGWWLPPGLLRGGQSVGGELALPILRRQPFSWQVLVAGGEPTPVAALTVAHGDLTEFLRLNGQTVLMVGGAPIMRCIYRVDQGRIEDDDLPGQPALERRHQVVARGSIVLVAGQVQRVLVVRRISGHAWSTLVPVERGYRLRIRVAIEEADADPIVLPLIGDARPMLLKQLETAANDGLADGLEGVLLPPWFPTGLRTDVTVE